jgi:hypothetical protein
MHHCVRARRRNALAWQVRVALGRRPDEPIAYARVIIERHGPRMLDADAAPGACKLLLDCLQPPSPRHPSGLGLIAGDDPRRLELIVRQIQCPASSAHVAVEISEIEPALT